MRTVVPPATGTVQWVADAPNGNRCLEIATQTECRTYEVVPREGGYLLLRSDYATSDVVCYTITVRSRHDWECNCPDARSRPERRCNCKHSLGLRAALRSLPF